MSMLAFYWGIFPKSRPTLRKAVYGVTAYVCCAYMVVLWIDTFYCGGNVAVQWSQEDGACSVFYAPDPFYINFSLNLSSYIFGKAYQWILRSCRLTMAFSLYAPVVLTPRHEKRPPRCHLLHLLPRCHPRPDVHDPFHHAQHGRHGAKSCL